MSSDPLICMLTVGMRMVDVVGDIGVEGRRGMVDVVAFCGGEERGDGGSPGILVGVSNEVAEGMTNYILWYSCCVGDLPTLRLIIGAELATLLRVCKVSAGKPQALGLIVDVPITYCDFMSSLGRLSL